MFIKIKTSPKLALAAQLYFNSFIRTSIVKKLTPAKAGSRTLMDQLFESNRIPYAMSNCEATKEELVSYKNTYMRIIGQSWIAFDAVSQVITGGGDAEAVFRNVIRLSERSGLRDALKNCDIEIKTTCEDSLLGAIRAHSTGEHHEFNEVLNTAINETDKSVLHEFQCEFKSGSTTDHYVIINDALWIAVSNDSNDASFVGKAQDVLDILTDIVEGSYWISLCK